ncbi:MAG: hypothetical protein WCY30_05805 [Candidatus Neomarinimicrobiota bacterium]|jgi:hypothetical protein
METSLTKEEKGLYRINLTVIPHARLFTLKPDSVNDEYEKLLLDISSGKYVRVSSSGQWMVDGNYHVQIHYNEIIKNKIKRTDVTVSEDNTEKSKNKEEPNEDIKSRSEALEFDNLNI